MQHDENTGTRKDMALHRLQVGREDLEAAQLLFRENKYRAANNRAYYAIYHAIDTVLSMYGIAFKRRTKPIKYLYLQGHFLREILERCPFLSNLIVQTTFRQSMKQKDRYVVQLKDYKWENGIYHIPIYGIFFIGMVA